MIGWFDFSPMRPDEYAATDAERWTETLECRNAIIEGHADAVAEWKAANGQPGSGR